MRIGLDRNFVPGTHASRSGSQRRSKGKNPAKSRRCSSRSGRCGCPSAWRTAPSAAPQRTHRKTLHRFADGRSKTKVQRSQSTPRHRAKASSIASLRKNAWASSDSRRLYAGPAPTARAGSKSQGSQSGRRSLSVLWKGPQRRSRHKSPTRSPHALPDSPTLVRGPRLFDLAIFSQTEPRVSKRPK